MALSQALGLMCEGYEQTSKQTKIIYETHFKQVELFTMSTVKLKPRDQLGKDQEDSTVQPSSILINYLPEGVICLLQDGVC